MQRLQLVPYSMIGWSEGVRTSLHAARDQSNTIRKLVLLAGCASLDARNVQMFKSKSILNKYNIANRLTGCIQVAR
jgi:hypothetical protein